MNPPPVESEIKINKSTTYDSMDPRCPKYLAWFRWPDLTNTPEMYHKDYYDWYNNAKYNELKKYIDDNIDDYKQFVRVTQDPYHLLSVNPDDTVTESHQRATTSFICIEFNSPLTQQDYYYYRHIYQYYCPIPPEGESSVLAARRIRKTFE